MIGKGSDQPLAGGRRNRHDERAERSKKGKWGGARHVSTSKVRMEDRGGGGSTRPRTKRIPAASTSRPSPRDRRSPAVFRASRAPNCAPITPPPHRDQTI